MYWTMEHRSGIEKHISAECWITWESGKDTQLCFEMAKVSYKPVGEVFFFFMMRL